MNRLQTGQQAFKRKIKQNGQEHMSIHLALISNYIPVMQLLFYFPLPMFSRKIYTTLPEQLLQLLCTSLCFCLFVQIFQISNIQKGHISD